jgi:dolichol-phosphate mannosyltransferase
LKVSTVIAAYDERENIEEVTRRLDRSLREIAGDDFETIFVVEGRDGTREILERLAAELGHIRILYRETPSGLGAAFRSGFAAVAPDADVVVTMDADLNHSPEELPRLVEAWRRSEADVLVGSRFVEGSRSEGIPLWKRGASAVLNKVIATFFDIEVLDKSSGYRVYRADALRRLTDYRNDDFAFLPEILIRATGAGMRIVEEPIHFRFRTRGVSKMSILPTSRSYLALLRSRFDGISVAALALLALGMTVRLLYAFPTHKFVPDADSLLSGLRALDILGGKLRVFYSHVRIGALESYMHVPPMLVLGITRAAVSIAPLFSGFATLLFFWFFLREIFGRRTALLALAFFAIPSPAYIAWTYMPNGYPETMLLCAAVLCLAARTARTGHSSAWTFALGLAAGLGVWQSLQTLTCTLPALIWLGARQPTLLRNRAFLALALTGFVVGASPWLAYNVVHPLGTFESNFVVQPAGGPAAWGSNAAYLLRYDAKELLIGKHPFAAEPHPPPVTRLEAILQAPAAVAYGLGFLALAWLALRGPPTGAPSPGARAGAWLLLMVAATVIVLDVVSGAGDVRGITVRYVLPFFFVAAAAAGLLVDALRRQSRWLAGLAAAVVLAFNLSGYYWPWGDYRRFWVKLDRADRTVVEYLESRGVRWVLGNYWAVYPLNFVSVRRVVALPLLDLEDHYGYVERLPARPVCWAIVARNPNWLRNWVQRAKVEGRISPVGDSFWVFLPSDAEVTRVSPAATLARLRATSVLGH